MDSLIAFVRNYNMNNGGKGCPRGVMLHVGGFSAKVITEAHESGDLVASVGGKGGSWPAGEKPESKNDASEPCTVKARMAALLGIIAQGGTVAPTDAAAILADYEKQNEKRRKVVDTATAA